MVEIFCENSLRLFFGKKFDNRSSTGYASKKIEFINMKLRIGKSSPFLQRVGFANIATYSSMGNKKVI